MGVQEQEGLKELKVSVILRIKGEKERTLLLNPGDVALLAHTRGSITIDGVRYLVDNARIELVTYSGCDFARSRFLLEARKAA